MAQQTVNIGAAPNDGTGDPLRTAFDKINDNFDELYPLAPTADQKAALVGASGTPSTANRYVLNSDTRLSDSRTPSGAAGGVLAGTYPNPSFANDVVTLAVMANMPQNTIIGRVSIGTGDPEYLTAAQARTVLDVYSTSQVPTTFIQLTDVPASYAGQAAKYLVVNAGETGLEFTTPGAGYTNENAQDAVGTILDNGTVGTIVFTYNDATPLISAVNKDASITNAKLANVGSATLKGRITGGIGSPEDLTATQARSVLDVYSVAEVDSLLSSFVSTFTALTDTPSSYTGQAGKTLVVNVGETALEFADPYNDERAQDAVALMLDNGSVGNINFSYNDVTPLVSGTLVGYTAGRILIGNGSSAVTTDPDLLYIAATNRFLAGSGFTVSGSGTMDNLTVLGTDHTISGGSASMRWLTVMGEVNTMQSSGVGGILNSSIFGGNSNTISATGFNIFNAFILGGAFNSITAPAAQTNSQLAFGRFNEVSESYAIAFGYRAKATGIGSWAFGTTPGTTSTSNETTIEKITAAGRHAINFSANSSSQTVGHGAYADYSVILGGQDHNIPSTSTHSVILGGNAIKARAADPDQVYVPNFNINTTPLNDDTLTQVLVRDSTTGQVKYRNVSSIAPLTVTVTIPTASVLTANTSPVELVPAPGANKYIAVVSLFISLAYAGTAYATNTSAQIRIGTTNIGTGSIVTILPATADVAFRYQPAQSPIPINQNLNFFVATGDPTDGNSDIKVTVLYRILDM